MTKLNTDLGPKSNNAAMSIKQLNTQQPDCHNPLATNKLADKISHNHNNYR